MKYELALKSVSRVWVKNSTTSPSMTSYMSAKASYPVSTDTFDKTSAFQQRVAASLNDVETAKAEMESSLNNELNGVRQQLGDEQIAHVALRVEKAELGARRQRALCGREGGVESPERPHEQCRAGSGYGYAGIF